jgi:hypothetical protein
MYNDDNNNLDNYNRHIDRGSGGGHIKEGYIDDDDSKRGYTKEEAYIKEEEEDIYRVLDGEWEL